MSGEERADVQALARLMFDARQEGIRELYPDSQPDRWGALDPSSRSVWSTAAQVLLSSDWLAAHDADLLDEQRKGIAEAIRASAPTLGDAYAREGLSHRRTGLLAAARIAETYGGDPR